MEGSHDVGVKADLALRGTVRDEFALGPSFMIHSF